MPIRSALAHALALLLLLLAAPSARAVETPIGEAAQNFTLTMQGDKILTAGRTHTGDREQFAIVRHLADGSLDPSFGDRGVVVTGLSGGADFISDVAVMPDGRIVAVGQAYAGERIAMGVVRYLPDGRLDGSFGDGGRVQVDMAPLADAHWAQPQTVAVRPDGRVMIGGYTAVSVEKKLAMGGDANPGDDILAALVALRADGTLDPSFGQDGRVMSNLEDDGLCCRSQWTDLSLAPDGSLLLSGKTSIGKREETDGRFVLARFTASGTPDEGFAPGGVRRYQLGDERDSRTGATALLAHGGSLFHVGRVDSKIGILKTDPAGNPDPGYGRGGLVLQAIDGIPSVPSTDQPNGMEVRTATAGPDGSVYVAPAVESANAPFRIAKFTPSGALDPSFGSGGVSRFDSPCAGGFYGLAHIGDALLGAGFSCSRFGLFRLSLRGVLDSAFGTSADPGAAPGGGGATGGGGGGSDSPSSSAPTGRDIVRVAHQSFTRKALKKGVPVTVTAKRKGTLEVALVVKRKALCSANRKKAGSGRTTVRIRCAKKALKKLRRGTKATLRIRLLPPGALPSEWSLPIKLR